MQTKRKFMMVAMVALMAAGAACSKKSSGNKSGGGAPAVNPPPATGGVTYAAYTGPWRFLHNVTSGDGACDTNVGVHEVGTLTVDDSGNFAVSARGVAGRVDLNSGAVTLNISETEPCGRGTGTGQLTSFTEGSGDYAQAGTSPHTYSWQMVR